MAAPVPTPVNLLVDALQDAWRAIQRHHRDLPSVVIVIGPGDNNRPQHGLTQWGYFMADRWMVGNRARTKTVPSPEVQISGESFKRPAVETFGTLLHEAAHALAFARRAKDTSREGRYHNERYKLLAEELLLTVGKRTETRGWSHTSMSKAASERYAAEIEALAAAQQKARDPHRRHLKAGQGRTFRDTLVCGCLLPRKIAVAPGIAVLGPIICGICRQPFRG